jgi:Tfp pilus assembly protein PilF
MLDVNPNSLFAYVILGEIFCEKGNPQQAAESIKKAMNILENNSDKNHRYFDQEHLREQNIASLKERLINIPSRCGKKP